VLEDEVEVGANTCVDRAGLGETRIGRGSKLDNLVQVGHNSQLGPAVVLAGQAGLAGSVTVGAGAQVGGQAGIADHRTVGPGARVGAQSGVTQDVPAGETVLGTPAMSARAVRRLWATWRRTARGLVRRG
jgi:UDP-3-O-[3-hydroxymyristoyl] glucosamine N-acyltransferase